MCLPSARSRESVCKSHELLFTKKGVQKHFLSARAATVSRNLKTDKKLMVELNNFEGLTFALACLEAELLIKRSKLHTTTS